MRHDVARAAMGFIGLGSVLMVGAAWLAWYVWGQPRNEGALVFSGLMGMTGAGTIVGFWPFLKSTTAPNGGSHAG